jgi:hypothetical protein
MDFCYLCENFFLLILFSNNFSNFAGMKMAGCNINKSQFMPLIAKEP